MSDSGQVIIKKVKKVSGDGHHGGAWKVAYADFVTAMMAFFLLMWLLNATTEDQRKGIADYFNPSIPLSPISGGGSDVLNGSSVFTEDTLAKDGTGGKKASTGSSDTETDSKTDEEGEEFKAARQERALNALKEGLMAAVEGQAADGLDNHIQMRVTPEGLVIELVDTDSFPLFQKGSTEASTTMSLLLEVIANSLSYVTNDISIVGHTDALAYSSTKNYSNWELSTDRALMARRMMVNYGLPTTQVSEVAGKADTDPLVDDKFAPQNRRISITILRS